MRQNNHRRKKVHSPSVKDGMKYVKIDDKTTIMVPVDVPEEEARERYLARINKSIREPYSPAGRPEEEPKSSTEEVPELVAESEDEE